MKKRKREKLILRDEEKRIEQERIKVFEEVEEKEIQKMVDYLMNTNRKCARCKLIFKCVRDDRKKWKKYYM